MNHALHVYYIYTYIYTYTIWCLLKPNAGSWSGLASHGDMAKLSVSNGVGFACAWIFVGALNWPHVENGSMLILRRDIGSGWNWTKIPDPHSCCWVTPGIQIAYPQPPTTPTPPLGSPPPKKWCLENPPLKILSIRTPTIGKLVICIIVYIYIIYICIQNMLRTTTLKWSTVDVSTFK